MRRCRIHDAAGLMLHIRKSLIGDPALCATYLPFALKEVRRLHDNGGGTRQWEIDKVLIKAHVVGNEGLVQIKELCVSKLESGAVVLGVRYIPYYKQVKTSDIYRSSELIARMVLDKKSKAPDRVAAGKSKVYALPDPLPPPDAVDFDPNAESGEVGSEPGPRATVQLELVSKNKILQSRRASRATGKMRLFIQALLGSCPDRFQAGGLDGVLAINRFNNVFNDSNGIYWLIDASGAGSYATELKFGACGEAIRHKLHTDPPLDMAERSVLEAHMFADLSIYKANYAIDAVMSAPRFIGTNIPYEDTEGNPYTNSWNFNKAGDEGICVKWTRSPNYYMGHFGQTYYIRSKVSRLHFTTGTQLGKVGKAVVDENTGRMIVIQVDTPPLPIITIVDDELSSDWAYHRNDFQIFDTAHGYNTWLEGDYVAYPLACSNVPIYACYAADDTENIFRFTRTQLAPLPPPVGFPTVSVCGNGSNEHREGGAVEHYAVTIAGGGISLTGTTKHELQDEFVRVSVFDGGQGTGPAQYEVFGALWYTPRGCGDLEPPVGDFAPHIVSVGYREHVRAVVHKEAGYYSGQQSGVVFLLVSPTNPNAVYIGAQDVERTIRSGTYSDGYGYSQFVFTPRAPRPIEETYPYREQALPAWTCELSNPDYFNMDTFYFATGVLDNENRTGLTTNVCVVSQAFTGNIFSKSASGDVNDITIGSEWDFVFWPEDYFMRVYNCFESFNGMANIATGYTNPTRKTVGISNEDAIEYVGYA